MSLNVLVVESSPQARKTIIQSLQEIGVRNVTEASDGPEAIRQYKEAQFDLLFIDWNLQGQQGRNLVQEIRQINRDVPIIATVPIAGQNFAQEADQAGASDLLVKPFTTEILREKFEKYAGASTR